MAVGDIDCYLWLLGNNYIVAHIVIMCYAVKE